MSHMYYNKQNFEVPDLVNVNACFLLIIDDNLVYMVNSNFRAVTPVKWELFNVSFVMHEHHSYMDQDS